MLLVGMLLTSTALSQEKPSEAPWNRRLVAGYGYNKIQIMRRNGTVECWVESKDKTCDAWMLPDRNIIYSCGKNDQMAQVDRILDSRE